MKETILRDIKNYPLINILNNKNRYKDMSNQSEMRYLEGSELEEAVKWMEVAVRTAENSPCRTDKRGVIIVKDGKLIGKGFNAPPIPFKCEPNYCGDSCRVPAVHGEMNAIFDAANNSYDVKGARMYHAKVEKGILQDSRKPRCADCSKHVLQAGIAEFVLKHEEGFTVYDAEEFHRISLENYRKRKLR